MENDANVVLLNYNENTKKVEAEFRTRFLIDILKTLGLPIDGIWDDKEQLSTDNKIKLRQILAAFNIEVIQNIDGEMKIYNNEGGKTRLIGAWNKPKYTLKKDPYQVDPSKKLFLEMKLNYSTIFESQ